MFKKKEISIHICKLGYAMNANEVYPWMLMRKCLLAMLILMLVILMLILMLLNLNTGYAHTGADLCIRIMSLCCTSQDYRIYITRYTIYQDFRIYTSHDFEYKSQDFEYTSQDIAHTSQDYWIYIQDFRKKERFTHHS